MTVDVCASNGQRWVYRGSIKEFEELLELEEQLPIMVDPPGTSDTGWLIIPSHVVAYRDEDD